MPQLPSRINSFFGFKAFPFTSNVDPDDYFVYPQFEQALQRLRFVADSRGIACLFAPVGTGKSTLIRALIHDLGKTQFSSVYIPQTTCSILDLYRAIAYGFDIEPASTKVKLSRQIQERLLSLSSSRKITPVLILDEAHLLHRPFFDELRLLLNVDADYSNPAMLLLAGQPQLQSSLRLSINEALNQRVILRVRLSSFDRDLSASYISHRLSLVGRSAPLFSPDALEAIFTYSNGIPRSIDRISQSALRVAFLNKSKDVDLDTITLAIDDLGL